MEKRKLTKQQIITTVKQLLIKQGFKPKKVFLADNWKNILKDEGVYNVEFFNDSKHYDININIDLDKITFIQELNY